MSRKSIKISLFLTLLLKVWFVSGQKFSFAAFTPESWSISGPAAVTSAAQWLLLSCWAPTTFHLYIQPGFKAPFTTSLSIEQMDYGSKSQQQRTEIMIQREICGERLRWPERPDRLRWALSSHLFSVCLLSLTWIFCLPQNLLLFGPYYFFLFLITSRVPNILTVLFHHCLKHRGLKFWCDDPVWSVWTRWVWFDEKLIPYSTCDTLFLF